MDLAFSPDEAAFALEARSWLAEHLVRPPAFADLDAEIAWGRAWQAELAAGRWVGLWWPEAYGGRGADPVEQHRLILQREQQHRLGRDHGHELQPAPLLIGGVAGGPLTFDRLPE